ncbi:MAG: hypothetical protein AAF703_16915 [Cyanobacteria bacterium P01_D01_bin.105]
MPPVALVATLIGDVFLHETLPPTQMVGIAVVLTSVVIGQQASSHH